MAINVAPTYEYVQQTLQGAYLRKARLVITGLAANVVNPVPHGLQSVPLNVFIVPTSAGGFHEAQPADVTNIYVASDGTGASCNRIVEY